MKIKTKLESNSPVTFVTHKLLPAVLLRKRSSNFAAFLGIILTASYPRWMTKSARVINSVAHSVRIFLGSQKMSCFSNFPVFRARPEKLCDFYWQQLRITCKSGWIAQAEKRYCVSKEGKSKLTS